MSVRTHYDTHLAHFYEWMVGDFVTAQDGQFEFFERNDIKPTQNKLAIDLGAGHGIQTLSLAKLGFQVHAIDFSKQLLDSLQARGKQFNISVFQRDLLAKENFEHPAELFICMGDTLSHLESSEQVCELFNQCYKSLVTHGKLVLSFRDYGQELFDVQRFIPVKSDDTKILTCMLEYAEDNVRVTDLLHEKTNGQWTLKSSSYLKLRITVRQVERWLSDVGFKIEGKQVIKGMHYLIGKK